MHHGLFDKPSSVILNMGKSSELQERTSEERIYLPVLAFSFRSSR